MLLEESKNVHCVKCEASLLRGLRNAKGEPTVKTKFPTKLHPNLPQGLFYRISVYSFLLLFFFLKILFVERGEEREKEERNINMWLPLECPLPGT